MPADRYGWVFFGVVTMFYIDCCDSFITLNILKNTLKFKF